MDRDWSLPAGTLEWSCIRTADHAVDCVYAPALFLASRRADAYPEVGLDLTLGDAATPDRLVESLEIATRMLAAVVRDADDDVRAIIFRRPAVLLGRPEDFAPRAALELILHAHDVCAGLGVPFDPPESWLGGCVSTRARGRCGRGRDTSSEAPTTPGQTSSPPRVAPRTRAHRPIR